MATNFVARDATSWHSPPLLLVLAFYNGWEHCNADCCVNIDADSSPYFKDFGNFVQ